MAASHRDRTVRADALRDVTVVGPSGGQSEPLKLLRATICKSRQFSTGSTVLDRPQPANIRGGFERFPGFVVSRVLDMKRTNLEIQLAAPGALAGQAVNRWRHGPHCCQVNAAKMQIDQRARPAVPFDVSWRGSSRVWPADPLALPSVSVTEFTGAVTAKLWVMGAAAK